MKADEKKVTALLKTARGQIDGIIKMAEENRYCVDIFNQIAAAEAVLKKAGREVLTAHLECCVTDALSSGEDITEKITELKTILTKLTS